MKLAHPRRARAPAQSRSPKPPLPAHPHWWSLSDRLHNPNLTEQEHEVFDLFLESGSDKKVAALLHISAHTVRNHLGMIEQKMGMRWRCVLLLHWWKLRAGHCRVPPVPFEDVATRRNSSFTENEMVVLLLFLDLGSDQEVAARLRRSLSTVRTHLRSIQIKMDVDGREELLLYFWKLRAEPNRPVLLGGTKWYPRALEPPSPPGRGPG